MPPPENFSSASNQGQARYAMLQTMAQMQDERGKEQQGLVGPGQDCKEARALALEDVMGRGEGRAP